MALQSPFFNNGKRDDVRPNTPNGAAMSPAATTAAPTIAPAANSVPAGEGEAKLTVGPNIKLKGVEITDCDTLVVEGSVEATMDSRMIQISERGSFKGSAEIDVAEIRGAFDGNLTVRQKLVIYSTGKVTGRIRYGKVVIEEGGQLSGEIEFGATATSTSTARPATPKLQVA
jgi:cytoskeletal protein CcmA (bactofilin family)